MLYYQAIEMDKEKGKSTMVNKLTANNNEVGNTNHELITNHIPCYKCTLIYNYLSGVFAKESKKINLIRMVCPPACRSICQRSRSTTRFMQNFILRFADPIKLWLKSDNNMRQFT